MQHAICAIIAVSVLAVRAVFAMAVAVLQRSSWSSLGGPPPGACSCAAVCRRSARLKQRYGMWLDWLSPCDGSARIPQHHQTSHRESAVLLLSIEASKPRIPESEWPCGRRSKRTNLHNWAQNMPPNVRAKPVPKPPGRTCLNRRAERAGKRPARHRNIDMFHRHVSKVVTTAHDNSSWESHMFQRLRLRMKRTLQKVTLIQLSTP